MRIRVLGAGFYGAHIASALLADGHDVEVHEIADRVFAGASGGIPARLHLGFHYARSKLTRAACQEHYAAFMGRYGHLTSGVAVNIYAIAAHDSLVDFGTYQQVLRGDVEFITIERPEEFGLRNVEGALLTGERHVVTDHARAHFEDALRGHIRYRQPAGRVDDPAWDWTIDATFCANDSANVDRYEPCITALLEGPTNCAVTICDGQFPSVYPWNEALGLSSLTSAKLTPLARCQDRAEAEHILKHVTADEVRARCGQMIEQMAEYWPAVRDHYRVADYRLSIRAMPRSGAAARLVDVARVGDRVLRIRAGKIDAILHAEQLVREMMCSL